VKLPRALLSLTLLAAFLVASGSARTRSPENQVFQFAHTTMSAPWPDGSTRTATLYLWVPEQCARVRGLVILATNVPEHMLVGHEAIRRACRENDLALVWGVPTFWRFGKVAPAPGAEPMDVKALPGSDARQVEFLEQLLAGLAAKSGYDEVARVPWLPIGESGHLLMVTGLVNERPARCLAAICVKNPQPPKNFTVPMLWTLGTGQEWGQTKVDLRVHWKNVGRPAAWAAERAQRDWPLSLIVEPGTGHFYCSDAMAEHFGRYIAAAARARLATDGSDALRPITPGDGTLAALPLPGADAADARFWFFNDNLARDAQQLSTTNWDAAPQLVGWVPGRGVRAEPFALNSVTKLHITTDGEFEVSADLLAAIPEGFVAAGTPLAAAAGAPVVEWICGPVAPVAPGKFRIALDRTWKTGAACYLIARHEGDAHTRRTVQPAHVTLVENRDGAPHTITFAPLPDVPAGTASRPLNAESSAGLPVEFFVVSGPAIVRDGRLVFTPVPPRAKWPVEVTVAAWQWGRATAPRVRTAEIVRRTFRLTAPTAHTP
jgi:hypothetical protein